MRIKEFLMLIKCFYVNIKSSKSLPKFIGEDVLDINNAENLKINFTDQVDFPKIIWMYWEDRQPPQYVQDIVRHTQFLNKNFEVILLHRDNIKDYLHDFSIKGEMPIANMTDLLRLKLLYEYGGIWIDATTIFNEDLNWVIKIAEKKNYDIIGYYKDKSTIDIKYPIIESWFLAAKPNNQMIKKWLDELSPLGDLGSELYFEKIKSRLDYNEIKQKIGRPEYLLVYLAQQIVMRENKGFNFYLKRSEDSAFLIQESMGWSNYEINYALCRLSVTEPLIPIIKLTSGDRILINEFINYNLVNETSVIGSIINKKRTKNIEYELV
ncbi:glycosyltransferase family 32 protein [Sphingobacterium daejeonense]|uniref:glycosyltransferase family 32 protein n=1 Tax=Sphingobacterium daejeonense TaxID=371142 RepID=UPI0010FCE24C|nr:capsular polysaccharide synthesis protein [Sphingobacterium daejeonense]